MSRVLFTLVQNPKKKGALLGYPKLDVLSISPIGAEQRKDGSWIITSGFWCIQHSPDGSKNIVFHHEDDIFSEYEEYIIKEV